MGVSQVSRRNPSAADRAFRLPHAMNDNHVGTGRCPVCHGAAEVALTLNEYCGDGLIHHRWHCRACGHDWVTVLHVSA